jgi:hypothetical protein
MGAQKWVYKLKTTSLICVHSHDLCRSVLLSHAYTIEGGTAPNCIIERSDMDDLEEQDRLDTNVLGTAGSE